MLTETNTGVTATDDSPLLTTVYSPVSPVRQPFKLLTGICDDIWSTRELIWLLFVRDTKAQFRQSVLGYLWLILPSLVSAAAWFLLNRSGLVQLSTGGQPAAQFILVGTTLWSAFGTMLTVPMDAIQAGRPVFTKMNVPIEAFILSAVGKSVFNLLISATVMIVILKLLGVQFGLTSLLFLPAALGLVFMATTIGLLLAPLSTLFTDIRRAVTAATGVLMFTVPVLFQVPEPGGDMFETVIRQNPLTPVFALSRDVLLTGKLDWLMGTMAWLSVCCPAMLFALIVLRVAKPHFVVRMGM